MKRVGEHQNDLGRIGTSEFLPRLLRSQGPKLNTHRAPSP